ncbi:hypothetical protein T484DRAFT_2890294 [Baffinella frigidus]|nr:hypothetical protein T484DRAFT_2890294 [Cryptophyta sp. CCMP2293]
MHTLQTLHAHPTSHQPAPHPRRYPLKRSSPLCAISAPRPVKRSPASRQEVRPVCYAAPYAHTLLRYTVFTHAVSAVSAASCLPRPPPAPVICSPASRQRAKSVALLHDTSPMNSEMHPRCQCCAPRGTTEPPRNPKPETLRQKPSNPTHPKSKTRNPKPYARNIKP